MYIIATMISLSYNIVFGPPTMSKPFTIHTQKSQDSDAKARYVNVEEILIRIPILDYFSTFWKTPEKTYQSTTGNTKISSLYQSSLVTYIKTRFNKQGLYYMISFKLEEYQWRLSMVSHILCQVCTSNIGILFCAVLTHLVSFRTHVLVAVECSNVAVSMGTITQLLVLRNGPSQCILKEQAYHWYIKNITQKQLYATKQQLAPIHQGALQ